MKRLTYLCLICTLSISTAADAATVRTVALSGQSAPGTPSGVNYGSFFSPVLNDAGQTAFTAILTGSGVVPTTNNLGIWSEGSGSLALVARRGSQAPGTSSGVNFNTLNPSSLVLNNSGQTAFWAQLTPIGGQGIWSEGSGTLGLVARIGQPAPGTPSGVFFSQGFQNPVLNDAGQTAFYSGLGGGGGFGIWSERSNSLALVALSGNQAPGTPSGVNFSQFGFNSPALNDGGQTAFNGFLAGGGADTTNNQGIWSEGSGSLALVVRSGNQAPGTPSGVNYNSFNFPVLNNTGQTAFSAGLTGSGVDSTSDSGIWSEGSGSLKLVARAGSQAPGTPSGVSFGFDPNFTFSSPLLNDGGQTAFFAGLVGNGVNSSNNSGIWSEGSGSLALVARAGSHAPATPSGVNFSGLTRSPALNDVGQIAFAAGLVGSGVDSTNSGGIWATDRTGVLQLIVRSGDSLEVAPGDFRTISGYALTVDSGNSDGRPSGFNNLGQLSFRATFTDGSAGIFVSNRVAVPEPSSLLLAALAAAGLFWRRRVHERLGGRGTLIFANRHSSGLAEISVN